MCVIGISAKETTVKRRKKTSVFPEIYFVSAFFIPATGSLAGMSRWVCRRNLDRHRINYILSYLGRAAISHG